MQEPAPAALAPAPAGGAPAPAALAPAPAGGAPALAVVPAPAPAGECLAAAVPPPPPLPFPGGGHGRGEPWDRPQRFWIARTHSHGLFQQTHPTDHQSTVQDISTKLTGKQRPAQTTSTRPTGKQSAALNTSTKPTGNQSTHKAGRPAGKRGVQEESPRGHQRKATAAAATRGDAEVVHLGLISARVSATEWLQPVSPIHRGYAHPLVAEHCHQGCCELQVVCGASQSSR